MERDQLDADRMVAIGVQLALALNAVHEAGLLHRDVKPSNVLVRDIGGQDHAYLADFGVARMSEAESDLTRTGWVIGTSGYLSPEQVQGYQPDSRSDLYALGCIIFEALTGRPPFTGANDQALRWAHATSPRPVASAICPSLGTRYDSFLSRALAIDPRDRFQSGRELAEALRSAHAQATAPSSQVTAALPAKPRQDANSQALPGPTLTPDVRSSGKPEATVIRSSAPPSATTTSGMPDSSKDVPTRIAGTDPRQRRAESGATVLVGKTGGSQPQSSNAPAAGHGASPAARPQAITSYWRFCLGLIFILGGWIALLANVPHKIGYSGSEVNKSDHLTHHLSEALVILIAVGVLLLISTFISAGSSKTRATSGRN